MGDNLLGDRELFLLRAVRGDNEVELALRGNSGDTEAGFIAEAVPGARSSGDTLGEDLLDVWMLGSTMDNSEAGLLSNRGVPITDSEGVLS